MNKLNKKILLILAAIFVVIAVAVAGVSYAYLTSNSSIDNKFTIGENDIELNEEFDPPKDINPGDSIRKKVWASDVGNTPVYIRAKVLFSDGDMKKNCEDLDIGDDWTYNSNDNYYYYTKKVEPGSKTSTLFTAVKIKDSADENDLKSFDVTVYMESVSSDKASSYSEAWN